MILVTYFLIAIANACVWSIVVLLAGASQGRTLFFWVLVFFLSLAMMLFVGGAQAANERLHR